MNLIDLDKELRTYSIHVGDKFLLEHTKRKVNFPGFGEDDLVHIHTKANNKIFKCIAYCIMLTENHVNRIVIGDNKKDIVERARGCSIKSSYEYFNLAESMGFIKLVGNKDGKVYYEVASVIDYKKDNVKLKSDNKYKLQYNSKTAVIQLAKKLKEASFSLMVSRMSYYAECIFKRCLTFVNNVNKKFKEDKKLPEWVNKLTVALLQEMWDIMKNGNEFVNIEKKAGNWKYDLVNWMKRRVSEMVCSRSYKAIQKMLGLSKNAIATIIRKLKGFVIRIQHNREEISYDEYLSVIECSYSKKNVFQFGDRFFRRKPNSYMLSGSIRTELEKKEDDPVWHIIMKKFFVDKDRKTQVVRRKLSKRWFFLAAHPEIRRQIVLAKKSRRKAG